MKRSLIYLALFIAFSAALATPALSYPFIISSGTNPSQGVLDHDGSYLYGTMDAGCLVQVIKLGGDTPLSPNSDGSPKLPDLLVLPNIHIGEGIVLEFFPEGQLGRFLSTSPYDGEETTKFIVRVWNSFEAAASTRYGDSPILTITGPITEWNIGGLFSDGPWLTTEVVWDTVPPSPPIFIIASQEPSGNIKLTWDPTEDAGTKGTMVRYKTDGSPPATTLEGALVVNRLTGESQVYIHTCTLEGVTYEYSAFCYDDRPNYSSPRSTREVSHDTLPPTVLIAAPTGTNVSTGTDTRVVITFDDLMSTVETYSSFTSEPVIPNGYLYSWTSQDKVLTIGHATPFPTGTTFLCTVETGAKDKAGNYLASDYTWAFRTIFGTPPIVSNILIDSLKRYPPETISSRPRIEADLDDIEYGHTGINGVRVSMGNYSYDYSPPLLWTIYSSSEGKLDMKFPRAMTPGNYTITVEAIDLDSNSSSESVSGLAVKGGSVKIDGRILIYPGPGIKSGVGTKFAYNLNVNAGIEIYIFDLTGHRRVYYKDCPSGGPGGMAGYNEVFWDGLSGTGQKLGKGVYTVQFFANSDLQKPIESIKVVIE